MNFADALNHLWPYGDKKIPGLKAGIVATAPAVFAKYSIKSQLVFNHIMAQISHECGAGFDVVENLNYTEQRLIQVWPRHFNTNNAVAYSHNPERLANFIYNPPQHNDLGNRAGSDDGWTYRGRGASQTTGRAGYDKLGRKVGLDLLGNPGLINDPAHFMECGAADFIMCGCLEPAELDDIVTVTRRLNGGEVGLDQRRDWYVKWKAANVPFPFIGGASVPPVISPRLPPSTQPAPQPNGSVWSAIASIISSIFKGKQS